MPEEQATGGGAEGGGIAGSALQKPHALHCGTDGCENVHSDHASRGGQKRCDAPGHLALLTVTGRGRCTAP